VSVQLGENGGSLQTSGEHGSTSIAVQADGTNVGVATKKK